MPNPNPLSPEEVAAYVASQFPDLRLGEDGNYHGNCVDPDHDGTGESHAGKFTLFAEDGGYNCFSGGCHGHLFDLHRKKSGLDPKASAREVYEIVGRQTAPRKIVATYEYRDANGALLYEKVRYEPKDFRWRHRAEAGGDWIWNLKGLGRVPYRLPELLAADTVFVVEGEKAADALAKLGAAATCGGGGAAKAGTTKVWPSELNPHFSGKNVVVIGDDDAPGRQNRDYVVSRLLPIAKSVKIVELPNPIGAEKADPFDWIAAGGTLEQLLALVDAAPPQVQPPTQSIAVTAGNSWCGDAELIVSRDRWGNVTGVMPLFENACRALESAPPFKGALGFNEFRLEATFLRACPEAEAKAGDALSDRHTRQVSRWLQSHGIRVNSNVAGEAMHAVAEKSVNHFHPVREYLRGLKWDGKPRLPTWLIDYFNVEDNLYTRAVGLKWMVSAVARVMDPGCKVDTMLVFESSQGKYKSSVIEALAVNRLWFAGDLPDVRHKDAKVQLQGKWIIELAELKSLRASDVNTVKQFLSTSSDTFRPPYGRTSIDAQRQTIFFGTTNDDDYLNDDENRRFWPIKACNAADDEGVLMARVEADRDQLWAEAAAEYDIRKDWPRSKCKWWLTREENALARVEQAARRAQDPWQSSIEQWCDDPKSIPFIDATGDRVFPTILSDGSRVLTSEILAHCLDIPKGNWKKSDECRVTGILKAMGWTKSGKQEMVNGVKSLRFWYRPEAQFELKEQ